MIRPNEAIIVASPVRQGGQHCLVFEFQNEFQNEFLQVVIQHCQGDIVDVIATE